MATEQATTDEHDDGPSENEIVQLCIWLNVATGRMCGRDVAPRGLLLCREHREAAERGDWRAP